MSRFSIRARLTVVFAMAMFVVLLLAGLFVFLRVSNELSAVIDEGLAARADDVAALVAGSGRGAPELQGRRFVEGEDGFSQILATDGRVIASTLPEQIGAVLNPSELAAARDSTQSVGERSVAGISGEARILARPSGSGSRRVIVVVGATNEDRTEALSGLRGALLIGAPIALLMAACLGYLLAGRALSPVAAMRRRAAEITLERSGERLPLPRAEDEIHHLGETLNAMLDRIEESLRRERVFVSDASHELRTPLATLRAEIELALRPRRSAKEMRAALRSAGEEVDRLSRLAEDLLVIARFDQGRLPVKRERVELTRLLEQVRDRFAARAAQDGREMRIDAPPGQQAEIDPLRVEQALGNLVDNALRHGAGMVRLGAVVAGEEVVLEVSDDGSGFARGFEQQAFERFTRADRGRTGPGAGLGLAITRAVAEAHGGRAEIVRQTRGGATVRLILPL